MNKVREKEITEKEKDKMARLSAKAFTGAQMIKDVYGLKSISASVEMAVDALIDLDKLVTVSHLDNVQLMDLNDEYGFDKFGTEHYLAVEDHIIGTGEELVLVPDALYIYLLDEMYESEFAYLQPGTTITNHEGTFPCVSSNRYLKAKNFISAGKCGLDDKLFAETPIFVSDKISKLFWDALVKEGIIEDKPAL